MITLAAYQPATRPETVVDRIDARCHQFRTATELTALLATQAPDGIVIVLGEAAGSGVQILADRGVGGSFMPPVIAATPSLPLAIRQVLSLIQARLDTRLSLLSAGQMALSAEVKRLLDGGHPARDQLIRRLAPFLSPEIAPLLLPALVIGGERATPADLAEAVGGPERTLRQRLARHKLPAPLRLLGLIAGCHQAFYAEECRLSPAAAARRAGFGSTDELRRYLKVRTGRAPAEWRELGLKGSLTLLASRLALDDLRGV